MLIIPAIDLLDGSCVRLYRGDYDCARRYDSDPVETARRFVAAGVRRLHVVDLDAARGTGNNREVIGRIVREVDVEIEVGGGIRSDDDVDELVGAGVGRLIVGTTLVKDPSRVESWIRRGGSRFIAGIDARDGKVRVSGWMEASTIDDAELAAQAAKMGFESIIYTNIALDGTLEGPDIERTNRIAEASGIGVILSGGVGTLDDLALVKRSAHPGVVGVITGKALYEGAFTIAEAVELYRERTR